MTYKCSDCDWEGEHPAIFSKEPMENGLCWNYYICPKCKGTKFEIDVKDGLKGHDDG